LNGGSIWIKVKALMTSDRESSIEVVVRSQGPITIFVRGGPLASITLDLPPCSTLVFEAPQGGSGRPHLRRGTLEYDAERARLDAELDEYVAAGAAERAVNRAARFGIKKTPLAPVVTAETLSAHLRPLSEDVADSGEQSE
jgi:hypothetical protein